MLIVYSLLPILYRILPGSMSNFIKIVIVIFIT